MKTAVLKTATYSVMHLVLAVSVAYALTRDWRAALAIGLIEPVVQTVGYFLHDRAWSRWDRRRPALAHAHTGLG